MVKIFRKESWELTSNDKQLNAILGMIEQNGGECPCHDESRDRHCPCTDYLENDICHCGLYRKV